MILDINAQVMIYLFLYSIWETQILLKRSIFNFWQLIQGIKEINNFIIKKYIYICIYLRLSYHLFYPVIHIHPVIIFSVDYISNTVPRSNFNHRIGQKYDDTFESIQYVIVRWERGCNNFRIQRSCTSVSKGRLFKWKKLYQANQEAPFY